MVLPCDRGNGDVAASGPAGPLYRKVGGGSRCTRGPGQSSDVELSQNSMARSYRHALHQVMIALQQLL